MNLKNTTLAAVIALGLAASAPAQTVTTPDSQTAAAASNPAGSGAGYGLLGENYTGVDYTYLRHEQNMPLVDHDYGMVFNQRLTTGLDFNANYDWLTGSANGVHDWRQDATGGLTGYLPMGWGKPFVDAEAGWAWQKFNGISRSEFMYSPGAGVELQATNLLAVTPYVAYQDFHHQYADWNYGLKTTYRFTQQWSATLDPQIDQHHNIGYELGLNLHY